MPVEPRRTGVVADCSVLVPVLNEERYIEQTLKTMRAQRFPGRLEFIFADGGSSDRTVQILRDHAERDPRIRVYANPRRTVASGLNVALSHASGRWIARMDAHTEYRDDYLAVGVERLQQGGTSWVSGPPIPVGHGPVSRAVALALGSAVGQGGSRKWRRAGDDAPHEFELDTGVFAGVWERRTLLAFGGWDEGWLVNEDAEMAGRFLARGERLICLPAMGARYVPRDTFRGLWRQYRGYGEYRVRTAGRHPRTMRLIQLIAPALVLDAVVAAAGPHGARRVARGALAAYVGLIVREGVRARPHAEVAGDAALVPVALATMHMSWGVGTWIGLIRFGPPTSALAHVLGIDRQRPGKPYRVFDPSLDLQAVDG